MFADSGGVSVHFLPVRAGAAGGGGRILRHAAGRDDATGGESGRSEGFPKDREQHTLRSAAQVRLDYLVTITITHPYFKSHFQNLLYNVKFSKDLSYKVLS